MFASRLLPVAVIALFGVTAFSAPASAELRTSHYLNPDTSEPGSATNPQVASMILSYETSTGSLDLHLRFFRPLADPTQTSALRQAFVTVELGDVFGGQEVFPGCERARDGLFIQAELGNPEPAIVGYERFGELLGGALTSKTFSADRSELELSAIDPRLAHLNLICARITAANNAENNASFYSNPFFLDGFTVFDGDTVWSAGRELGNQARYVDNNLGRRGSRWFPDGASNGFACHGGGYLFQCRGRRQMRAMVGQPTLTVRGSQTFALRPSLLGELMVWSHNERATLLWTHCPRTLRIAHARTGHPCSLVAKWRHGDLWPLFERSGLRAVTIK